MTGAPTRPASPLSIPIFRAFWIAMVFSNIGTYAHDVAVGWVMTGLTTSPVLVTSIQVAATLPIFLLGVPAGALADIVNRRLLILRTQLFMLAVCVALAALTFFQLLNPWIILGATALLGIATALAMPGMQATIPDLVPGSALPGALALSSSSINISRAVGPALAAFVLGIAGPGVVFLFNALSFVGIITVLSAWKPAAPITTLPPESLFGALKVGFRYARYSATFRAVLWRVAFFVLPASGLWALMPLFSRVRLGASPTEYGLLMAALGAGALLGVALLPRVRRLCSQQAISVLGALGFGAGAAALSFLREPLFAGAVLLIAGVCWLLAMTTLNLSAQTELPTWVRARGLGANLMAFSGSMALGGLLWGGLAEWTGSHLSLRAAGGATVLLGLAGLAIPLRQPAPESLASTNTWPDPPAGRHVALDQGPVLVTVEYHVDASERGAFLAAISQLRLSRLREGAYRWSVHESVEPAGRFFESFELESWADHLRQHERVSKADAEVEQRVDAFNRGDGPPLVRHYVASQLPRES
ncbi:MAG: MFS transporter [Candidatus Sumerlaeia bacterium]|nr:MFS transporter [Candidatus Sumerlaeia bacterium]